VVAGLRATARELGISHVALLKAESDGRVPKRVAGAFDVEVCRKALGLNSHPAKSSAGRSQQLARRVSPEPVPAAEPPEGLASSTDPQGNSVAEAVRQLEWAKVRALTLKIDREEGRLIELVAVNAFVAGMIMRARDELVRIGAEIADTLARESDPVKCRAQVDDRIFQALENLKQYQPV
jgi:hypothetical protein